MKTRLFSAVVMAGLLAVGLLAGPAFAQEEEEPPEEVELEDDEVLGDYVLDVVIDADEEPEAEPEGEPDVAVLGVTQERLPVTGGDLLGLTVVGLALVGLGYLAVRRTRPTADLD